MINKDKLRRIVISEYLWWRSNNRPLLSSTRQWAVGEHIVKSIQIRKLAEKAILSRPYEDFQ